MKNLKYILIILFMISSTLLISSCGNNDENKEETKEETKEDNKDESKTEEPHVHSYKLKQDLENHWQECECKDKKEIEKHSFGDWTTTKNPTEETAGTKERECNTCQYKEFNTIPVLDNVLEYLLSSDEKSYYVSGVKDLEKTNIKIPNEYNGLPVTGISNSAFWHRDNITSITIPESVTIIGSNVFEGCSSLTSITIPDSVTSIGSGAFKYCSSLSDVIISNSIKKIEGYTFGDCTSLKNVTIPNGVTIIGNSAFENCSSLTNITIPESVTSIDVYAFQRCMNLISVTIPKSVKNIDSNAFYDCCRLVEVYNLSSLNIEIGSFDNGYVGYYAKAIHKSLEEESNLIIKDDYLFIKDNENKYYLVIYNGNLTEIELPQDIDGNNYEIFNYCFTNCRNITSVAISNKVTGIGDYAFYNCEKLTNIIIPESVTSIGSGAFYNCSKLINIVIPDSVTSMGSFAFRDCNSLTNITLSNNITNIGLNAFLDCISLTDIIIPNKVKSIGMYAFEGCTSLKNIVIPKSVTSIGSGAFNECNTIKNVYYEGTTSDWQNISISDNNNYLSRANRYYYSESKPSDNTKSWYYDDNKKICIWD